MKIAMDVRTIVPERTGIGQYAQELARGLARVAPAHRYLFFGAAGARPAVRPDGRGVEYQWTRATPSDRYRRDLWENVLLPHRLGRWRADVFHSTAWLLPIRRVRQATVVTVHDTTHFKLRNLHNRLIGPRFRLRARRSIALADAIITVSEATRRDVIDEFGVAEEQVSVVYNGVDQRFTPTPDSAARARLRRQGLRAPFILSVGTIEPRKNHVRLILAFERLAPRFPDLQLVLAGRRGWMYDAVFAAIAASPVRDRIQYREYVPDDDLPELYRMASVLAYPSLYEGFGLPPLEALASGTPVLTANCSSLPEVVGEAGVLVDPMSVDAIAGGLAELLANDGARDHFRQAGLAQAAHFTWDGAARATLAVYERALSRRRACA